MQIDAKKLEFTQQRVDAENGLFSVIFTFNRINGATRSTRQRIFELGIFAKSTSIAQERIFFVVID